LGLDRNGNVFVVDSGNNRIQEFSPTGQFMALDHLGMGLLKLKRP
jgi:NHL repeat